MDCDDFIVFLDFIKDPRKKEGKHDNEKEETKIYQAIVLEKSKF